MTTLRSCRAAFLALCGALALAGPSSGQVSGTLAKWNTVTVDFAGPSASETGTVNPFLDYRLNVTFSHAATGKTYVVPGFFDGDGAGGASGNVWRARFTPDEPGAWTYTASFRQGSNVAINLSASAGTATSFNGTGGNFTVAGLDPAAPGFLKWGRLEYVPNAGLASHYLKFRDGGYWIKGGADSPENFLGYSGFDNTPNYRHQYASHVADWQSGNPDWGSGKGKGIIGALNYLASQKVNSIYFMPMNIGGDGQDTWPYEGPIARGGSTSNEDTRFDVSKLAQWETVFAHAEQKGIHLHCVLMEAEAANKNELDSAALGTERKLFYREMIARFGHHLALQWNISEEYNYQLVLSEATIRTFADYIRAADPYGHPITVHNYDSNLANSWYKLLGEDRWSLTSIQQYGASNGLGAVVEDMRTRSANAGRPLAVMIDEPASISGMTAETVRKRMIWDIYLSGGGAEWFVSNADQSLENFRTYEDVWRFTWFARKFMEENLPFWQMAPADGLVTGEASTNGGAEVFAKPGQVYAIYFPDAADTGLFDLRGQSADFYLRWFDPRTGDFAPGQTLLHGGQQIALAAPSSDDWTALITIVPEPATLALLGLGAAAGAIRRRTRFISRDTIPLFH